MVWASHSRGQKPSFASFAPSRAVPKGQTKRKQSAFTVARSHVSKTSFPLNNDQAKHFPSYALEGFTGLVPWDLCNPGD